MDLYREGWATKMHPNADVAVSALTDARFMFTVCSQPACPDYEPQ